MTSDADKGADGNGYGAITVNRYAVNPELDDAGLAHWLYSLGTTFIFFRTRHQPAYHHRDAPPRCAPGHLRLQWHLPRCWHNFTADARPARRCIAEETGGGREEEAFDDYDCIPPSPYYHWLSTSASVRPT